MERLVAAGAAMAGATQMPVITATQRVPVVANDPAALERTLGGFASWMDPTRILDAGIGTGSDDVGLLAAEADAPLAYWLLGAGDPVEPPAPTPPRLRSSHALPCDADADLAIPMGTRAMVSAARTWLPPRR